VIFNIRAGTLETRFELSEDRFDIRDVGGANQFLSRPEFFSLNARKVQFLARKPHRRGASLQMANYNSRYMSFRMLPSSHRLMTIGLS
jgi:hypothetical protein